MSTQSIIKSSSGSHWFRWLSRALLIAASLSRILYVIFFHLAIKLVGPKYWEWNHWGSIIPVVIITAIAWFAPTIGGILAILWFPVLWLGLAIEALMIGGLIDDPAAVIETVLVAAGGVMSIIWGIRKRKRNGQSPT